MSVTVKFWSFSKRKNSTLIPTASPSYSYDCQIKAETTLINPIIELNTDQAKGCNYAQITDFGRYYFIRDWTFDRGLWTASLEEDVLGSWKSQIGSQTLYVARSASSYDGDIKDMYYPTKVGTTNNFVTINNIGTSTFTTGVFVIGVLGNNTASGGSVYYQMTPLEFGTLVHDLFVEADGNVTWADVVQGIKNAIMNPTQYVVSCRWYPTGFDSSVYSTDLNLGVWPSGDTYGTKLTGNLTPITESVTLPKHPLASTRGDYMNLSPFSRYAFQWGSRYDLDTSLIAKESNIHIRLTPDFTQTEAFLQIFPGTLNTNIPMVSTYVPYGVDIPLSQSSINPGALLSVGAGLAESMLTGDVLGAAAGILSAASAIAPGVSSTKSGGGIVTAMATPYLSCTFYDVVDDDLTEFGRPLMKRKQISTLSGYIQCQSDDISIACLDPERESIREFMTGGFFYE